MAGLPDNILQEEVPSDPSDTKYPLSRCFYWGPPPSYDHLVPLRTDLARKVLKLWLKGMPVETKARLLYIDQPRCVYKFKFNGKRYLISDRRFEYDPHGTAILGSRRLVDMLRNKVGAIPTSLQRAFAAAAHNEPWRELAEAALKATEAGEE